MLLALQRKPALDMSVRVERSTGLTEYYDLRAVKLLLHPEQLGYGRVSGRTVYNYLKNEGMLEICLGIDDAVAIQKLGTTTFRKFFRGRILYFWASFDDRGINGARVTRLFECCNKLVLDKVVLGSRLWDCNHPAAILESLSPSSNLNSGFSEPVHL